VEDSKQRYLESVWSLFWPSQDVVTAAGNEIVIKSNVMFRYYLILFIFDNSKLPL
jgi:hypothetical protein